MKNCRIQISCSKQELDAFNKAFDRGFRSKMLLEIVKLLTTIQTEENKNALYSCAMEPLNRDKLAMLIKGNNHVSA